MTLSDGHMDFLVVLFFSLLSISCAGNRPQVSTSYDVIQEDVSSHVSYQSLGDIIGKRIIITHDIDLKGGECKLPNNSILEFKNGVIRNGAIEGSNTKIVNRKAVFDHVAILGSWIVPEISTGLFVDLSYENSLKELFALANPDIHNKITVGEGVYPIKALSEWSHCLKIGSNTDLILNGIIELKPNNYKGCDILFVEGKNITVTGTGAIIGDKHTHTGTTGEWGMGIKIHNGQNVKVTGVTVRDCWGDCIYVGDESTNVSIERCILDNGRRQGISITSGADIKIKKCFIKNVGGSLPEYAIDIEPNKYESVKNVTIENVEVVDCKGGFLVYGRADKASIKNVSIKKCTLKGLKTMPIRIEKCGEINIKDCVVKTKREKVVLYEDVGKITIKNIRTPLF